MSIEPARLKDVFSQALARTDPADRAAFLDAACTGDAALRSRVEALLRASDRTRCSIRPAACPRRRGAAATSARNGSPAD